MSRLKVLRITLVLLMVLTMALPAGVTFARQPQAKDVSLRLDAEEIQQAKLPDDLLAAFAEDEYVHVLIKFKEQVDTQQVADAAVEKMPATASAYQKKMAARYAVFNALRETAADTQGRVLDYLDAEQAKGNVKEYDSFYIVNMVHAHTTEAVVKELALRPEVEKILLSSWIPMEKPVHVDAEIQTGPGRQWNLDKIGAYAVWDTYGLDGTGVVVGMIDTGTYYQHEALVEKWRGYSEEGFDPVYNWFDAIAGQEMPYDEVGHGTHVMGTIVGGHPETNNYIGVAPGAKWISTKAFEADGGYDHWILAAAEYLLAPTDEDGEPNPAMAPNIINNSWGGGPGKDEWFRPMVQSWRAFGIVPVFSAGNTTGGSSPGSVSAPANYPESLAVAAVDSDDIRASFSNQGPGPYEDDLKPDVSAPGVAIRSSVPGNGYEGTWSGTSMAAPHVSGAAALLLQADASLSVDMIEEALYETTRPLTDSQYPESPNYGYGRGLINVFDAVTHMISGFGTITGQVTTEGNDAGPPAVEHTPVESCYAEMDVPLLARATDDIAVYTTEIWVKAPEDEDWTIIEMSLTDGDYKDGEFTGIIPWMYAVEPGFTYKIVVSDWIGNTVETPEYDVPVAFGAEPGIKWDFESYPYGWYMDGDWQWGEPVVGPEPLTGTRLVGTNLTGNYSNYSDSWFLSPPLDLRNASEASFRLSHWYDMENNYDRGYVAITDDYGETWETVAQFTGREQQWHTLLVDLNPYCGSEEAVYVLFNFTSDVSVNYPGWYIDAIDYVGVDTEAPGVPQNLQATATVSGVRLEWEAVTDIDVAGYVVYRSETSGGPYVQIGEVPTPLFVDKSYVGGTEYFYVVTAIDFSSNESPYSNEASVIAPHIDVVYFSDFEADDGGFVSGGDNDSWEWGIPASGPNSAYSGTSVWATNLTGNYATSSNCWLESPEIDLSGYQSAVLEFARWFYIENSWDNAYVEVSSDGGSTWDTLAQYTGTGTSWAVENIPLTEYVGGTISVRFRMESDYSVVYPGLYIDDFAVLAAVDADTVSVPKESISVNDPSVPHQFGKIRKGLSLHAIYSNEEIRPQNTGIPVDAVVTVVETNRSTRTDQGGRYRMIHSVVPEGETWTLRFEAYGYYTEEVPFTLEKDQVLEKDVFLEPIPRGNIEGTIVSSRTGEPIAGAREVLLEDDRVPSVLSDEEGKFSLDNVLEGNYTLRVSAEGFVLMELPVEVVGGETANVLVELEPFIGYEDEIAYDDGEAENARAFYDGGNGWGVRFTPDGLAQIAGASVYIWGTDWPSPGDNKVSVAVFDSLPNGEPGEMVIEPFVVEGNRGAWNYIDLSSFGFVTDRDFYIISVQVGNYPDCAGLGFDESSSEGRTYEWFAGEFSLVAPDYGNAMVRAHVKYELDPPALLAPADGTHTNADSITVTGFVNTDSLVRLYVNGTEAAAMEVARGEFQADIDLVEGENLITATAEIEAGATDPSEPLLVIKDTVAPVVEITSPVDNLVTNKEVVTVEGSVRDDYLATVRVNGEAIEFAPDGTFSTRIIVEEGANLITVEAVDFAGNPAAETVTVYVDLIEPELYEMEPAVDKTVFPGEILEFSFVSDSVGGSATFVVVLPGQKVLNSHRHEMWEVADGVYLGTWEVPWDARFTGAVVEFELVDAAGNRTAAVAPGKLSTAWVGCQRLAGDNRYATAVEISKAGWNTSEYVVLATGTNFADALAGAPLAYALNAPILLTAPTSLPAVTAEEIQRLDADKVIILGGIGAISEQVEDELVAMDLVVERIYGANRFETAKLIAAEVAPEGAAKAVLVNGIDFPDALSAAPYAARQGMPILLTRAESMPVSTAQALEELGVNETIVIGGSGVISDEIIADVPGAIRVWGSNRYATSVAVAEYFEPDTAHIYVATGLEFADALTGAVLAAKNNSGILLAGDTLPEEMVSFITENRVVQVTVFGGEGAVSPALVTLIEALLR